MSSNDDNAIREELDPFVVDDAELLDPEDGPEVEEQSSEDSSGKSAALPTAKEARRKKRKKRKKRQRRRKRQIRALADAKELHRVNESSEVAIRFDHVTKTYDLYRSDSAQFLGVFNIKGKGYIGPVKANDDLSFEIKKGEAVAFMGLNGAGKSTALKMITGVTHPTSGTIEVNGRVSALLELSAGFDKRLTGRENIHLRGQILGMTEEEIDRIEPQVVSFADLGVYIDQPMRSYSSGMKARLGFALAVNINPEILVVDEALSVGDRKFKRKCIKRIRKIMMDANLTVLFVTHSSSTAREFCSRGIVLEQGKKVFDGPMDDAMVYYNNRNNDDDDASDASD